MTRHWVWAWTLCALTTGCDSAQRSLVVELRTDLNAPREVDAIHLDLIAGIEPGRPSEVVVGPIRLDAESRLFEGERLFETSDLDSGEYLIRLSVNRGTMRIGQRIVLVDLRAESQIVTIVFTRDCAGVVCDDPSASCLAGRCVAAECWTGTEIGCPSPMCESDAACAEGSACENHVCVSGNCLHRLDDSQCDESHPVCAPDRGCSPEFPALEPRVGLGGQHSCVLASSGPLCWGSNASNQLAIEGSDDSTVPVNATALSGSFAAIDAGADFSCALRGSGEVVCWGSNAAGQLGDGTQDERAAPVETLPMPPIAELTLGTLSACARTSEGELYCWGGNSSGEVGDGGNTARPTPQRVEGLTDVVQASLQGPHGCALLRDGSIPCWGRSRWGELGEGTVGLSRQTPRPVAGIDSAIQVSVADEHVCALRADRSVWCWGRRDGMPAPTPTPLTLDVPAEQLDSQGSVTCIVLVDGRIRCIGANRNGQLGIGEFNAGLVEPSEDVIDLLGARSVRVGGGHSCAVASEGLWCWGRGADGQLGNGRTEDSAVAVRIEEASFD